ncbi:MAG: hypothetical protein A3E01_09870 [Gammaproteobacteria bacterium RIFCSPHIGHO2_12_FULL_63_22]|nr:MAG: hypothetical protein A3E01_09870 [Gammaproteobacteria bacterium RIFCSPHIGHO2_12_FULL_63_22]
MYVQRHAVTVTTASDGSATVYSPTVTGRLSQIRYVKTDFSDGVDFNITAEATGETLWAEDNVNASATRAPRQATHGTDGVASLFAGAGTAVQAPIALANDRVKIVIAAGGDAKTGTFHFVFE